MKTFRAFQLLFPSLLGAIVVGSAPHATLAATQAVFVGIDRYANSRQHSPATGAEFDDLEDSVADVALLKKAIAQRLAGALDPGATAEIPGCAWRNAVSTTLVDRCATRDAILGALNARITAAERGDTVFFFFSGIGSSSKITGKGSPQSTLIPSDGRDHEGLIPDIGLSELSALEAESDRRGVRLFSVLEACGAGPVPQWQTRTAPPGIAGPELGLSAAPSSTPRRIRLDCGGNPGDSADFSAFGGSSGDLTQALIQELKGGKAPWEPRAPPPPPVVRDRPTTIYDSSHLPQTGFATDSSGSDLVFIPPDPPVGVAGGQPAAENEAPFMVELRRSAPMAKGYPDNAVARHFCDGALITLRWVVTAAHCLENAHDVIDTAVWMPRTLVRMGSSNLNGPMREFHIVKAIVHGDYCNPNLQPDCNLVINDIALLLLDRSPDPADRNRIRQVPVAQLDSTLPPGAVVRVLGWGASSVDNETKQIGEAHLQKVDLKVVDPETCRQKNGEVARAEDPDDVEFDQPLPETLFCAGSTEGRKDACRGDSGGPVVTIDDHKRPTLVGIVSFGLACTHAPGFYTKVVRFRSWMNTVMNQYETDDP